MLRRKSLRFIKIRNYDYKMRDENSTISENKSVDSRRRNSHNSAVVSRFELRFPSRFGGQTLERAAAEIIEEEEYHSTKNDRTVNYRKCICPFVLGIVLMFTGIALLAIGLAVRGKFDILGYLGGICILLALMFMIFWYICSLEVEDREMPKIILPKKSKAPPHWMKESRTQSRIGTPGTPTNCGLMCFPIKNDIESKAVVELDELSTSTSSKNADHFPNSRSPPFVGFESNGVDNPAFDAPFENTSC